MEMEINMLHEELLDNILNAQLSDQNKLKIIIDMLKMIEEFDESSRMSERVLFARELREMHRGEAVEKILLVAENS